MDTEQELIDHLNQILEELGVPPLLPLQPVGYRIPATPEQIREWESLAGQHRQQDLEGLRWLAEHPLASLH